jgi:hypothetical protein
MAGRIGYARIPCLGVLAGGLALIAMATRAGRRTSGTG